MAKVRNLLVIMGDQLTHESAVFDDFEAARDAVWMAEVDHESTRFWYHKQHLVVVLAAMRHFRQELADKGQTVYYHELTADKAADRGPDFPSILRQDVAKLKPDKLVMVRPGDYQVLHALRQAADGLNLTLELRPDTHFYGSVADFRAYAEGKQRLRLEDFYRAMRQRHQILMTADNQPVGGRWNFDAANRESFKDDPGPITGPHSFQTDEITEAVINLVEQRFGDHPGRLADFDLPVTHRQARTMLRDFVERSLPHFGRYEDAMWTDQPFLYHSRLSCPLNLKLLSPKTCVEAAVQAYDAGRAPLNSVEGFVRQLLGWREFVRGLYWLRMPEYAQQNYLAHDLGVPSFFWDGETDMACVRQAMQAVLKYGYTHHIQRLMVLGLLAQLLGVHPYKFHEWHMAMYLDAVDWVSLPNALGMSQYGDGGLIGTKPYCASGNYINKMSNYCQHCRYNYRQAVGETACPFTTLYWDFLDRHFEKLKTNGRMNFQLKNLEKRRRDQAEMAAIRQQAAKLKQQWG